MHIKRMEASYKIKQYKTDYMLYNNIDVTKTSFNLLIEHHKTTYTHNVGVYKYMCSSITRL